MLDGRWIYREMGGHTWRAGSFVRNVFWAAARTLFSHASVTQSVTPGPIFLFGVLVGQSLKFLPILTFCKPTSLMLNPRGFVYLREVDTPSRTGL